MAAQIPNAKMVELDSDDHLIGLTDALDSMVNEIQDFVEGTTPADDLRPALARVLCVDVPAGVTADEAIRRIQRYRGSVVSQDDGVLATFDGPARAIRCASEIVAHAAPAGRSRAGLHCGECEVGDGEIRGVAVSIARELARHAAPGDVEASQTVRDLVFGSEITLADSDGPALDSLPGRWTAFRVASV
jgi:class 3 adenylate cyclase